MRVLIDTNVLIERENHHLVPPNLQQLLRILNERSVGILVHPHSMEELKRDGNEQRRRIALSKVQTYSVLESPPDPSSDSSFLDIVGLPISINDQTDNALLYAVHRNAVGFLITEDRGIHSKASRLNLREQVLSVEEALRVFRTDDVQEVLISLPALREEYVYNLKPHDPFFDSLKSDYVGFTGWWKRICREGRKSWVHFDVDGSIGALLIFKVEHEPIDSTPPISAKNRLKLCTFKVARTGHKIGELFVKLSVQFCVRNQLDELYLTHFTEPDDDLVDLISEYGFLRVARKGGEDVYLKRLIPNRNEAKNLHPSEISRRFYPTFYDGPHVRKFIVPIRPEYHDRLFTDYAGRQTRIDEHIGQFIVEGNTIDKAYLCHSPTRTLAKGHVLLFYRSVDSSEITSLGVVEHAFVRRDYEEVVKQVGKRTVYTLDEIQEIVKKPTLVILFRWHFHLPKPLGIAELIQMDILERAPQSIVRLEHRNYLKIKTRGELNERYTVN